VGKGFLATTYGQLWGNHYTTISQNEHVVGRFNAHLFAKRLVFIDEGTYGGNKREAGVIKTRITEPWIIMEQKGVDPIRLRNRMIFMVASNENSIIAADKADRRWMVFKVSSKRRDDRAYFQRIADQMQAGGYAGMLFDLLARDLSKGPDPRQIIRTEALFEQFIWSARSEVKYLHQVLAQGRLPQSDFSGAANVSTIKALWAELQQMFPDHKWLAMNALGMFLKDVFPGIPTRINGRFLVRRGGGGEGYDEIERSTMYIFPDLGACRLAFERYVGMPVSWPDEPTNWQQDFTV
jgi:hypothetical protein